MASISSPIARLRRASETPLLRSDLAAALGAMLLALAFAVLVLRLWEGSYSVPLSYTGDGVFNLAEIKATLQHGWYFHNPDLGAPFGQYEYDFPAFAGDTISLVTMKALGVVASTAPTVENAFYLLGYPLIALTAFLAFRRLRIGTASSVVCAVLFSLAPYHLVRNEGHLFLGAYFAVPFGALLVMLGLIGEPLFERRARPGPKALAWTSRRTLITLVLCVVVGCGDNYYSTFTVMLLLLSAVFVAYARRSLRPVVPLVVASLAIAVVAGANDLPTILYKSAHGPNPVVGHRLPQESETFSLNLTQLVVPVTQHRLQPLAQLSAKYPLPPEPSANLGSIAAVAFIALGLLGLVMVVSPVRRARMDPRAGAAGVGAWLAFLIGTTGGLSALISYYVSPQIRAYNRISVFISFFCLIAVGLFLDWLRPRVRVAPVAFGALLTLILVLGVLDQSTAINVPPYHRLAADFNNDIRFNGAIERRLPAGSSVFQFPYMAHPENGPINGMQDYEPMRAYVSSNNLRWSYGAMRGRPQDWQSDLTAAPLSALLPDIAAAGFAGVWVDRNGYSDNGHALETELARFLGPPALISPNQQFSFFDLRQYRSELVRAYGAGRVAGLRTAALYPLDGDWSNGFYQSEAASGHTWHWARARARFQITNHSSRPRDVLLAVRLSTAAPAAVTIGYPGGASTTTDVSDPRGGLTNRLVGAIVRKRFTIPPGRSYIDFSTNAPPARDPSGTQGDLRVQAADMTVTDVDVCLPGLRIGPPVAPPAGAPGVCTEGPPQPLPGELAAPLAG